MSGLKHHNIKAEVEVYGTVLYSTALYLMLQNRRRGMKASLSAAMVRVTREPAQLGRGHDTQCAWSNDRSAQTRGGVSSSSPLSCPGGHTS